ncbi:AP2-like ethylene-responsive transcription factor AIL7, partial [Mucuna pruriens]
MLTQQSKSSMEEFSSLLEGQTSMEPTISTTQEGVSRDWTQESVIPQHQLTPQIGTSSQGSVNNNFTNFSTQQCDILSVLEATLDERHIEDSLVRSKLLSHQLGPHTMNDREPNNRRENDQRQHGGHRNLSGKTIGNKSSLYRGVIKCNEQRFEAFVWDNTDPGDKGRIGGYWTEIDAARAHDLLSIKMGGLTTLTNFPVRCYSTEMDEMQSMNKMDYIHAVRSTL